jgi:hypothetical protein
MGLLTDDVLCGDRRIDNAVLLESEFYFTKPTHLGVKPMYVVTPYAVALFPQFSMK